MKKIKLKYNPYLVTTDVTVDGQPPKSNSALNVGKKRLQEWIEDLPQIILDEYRDCNVSIDFTGTTSDYEDIEIVLDSCKDKISSECNFHKMADIADVEHEIDSIFNDIQQGPIPELKDEKIVSAFNKAKDSKFEINVVATMSSGKSTLINALLGRQLMPAANEATTATIVKIVDTDQDNFSAIAYDKSGQIVKKLNNVSLNDMKDLNSDEKVSTVELRGKIPFVTSVGGMKLVLVDTPGPNNSRDKSHEQMTYRMIADSDKSLVLYVMNGQQLGINDEKNFLDYICSCMKEGGKQGRERFIFAVNKMDAFKPKDEGVDCIERALVNVKKGLEDRNIDRPNIFPVTACAALELRTEDDEPMALDNFVRGTKKYESLHFNSYYHYSNLPKTVRLELERLLDNADDRDRVEIHTGIVSIERAIALYVNKYARTMKVCDLVSSFNDKLGELAAVANLEAAIRKDKDAKAALEKQINQIKANIKSAQNAQIHSKRIDSIDLTEEVQKNVHAYVASVRNKISRLMSGDSKVEKSKAEAECDKIEKECKAISMQIEVEMDKILNKAYSNTMNKIVEEYKKYLSDLNVGIDTKALTFNAVNLVSTSLADLKSIIAANTEEVDESYTVDATRTVRREGNIFRKTVSFITFGTIKDYTTETEKYKKRIDKYVDYVDMSEVTTDYLTPFQENLKAIEDGAISHVISETKRLKEHLKKELVKIDQVLNEKLDMLSHTEADSKAKADEIAQKEANLKWLENIQKRVNDIINF